MYEVKVLGAERALKATDDLHNALALLKRKSVMQVNNHAVLGIVDTTTGELLTYTA